MRNFEALLIVIILIFALLGHLEAALLALGLLVGFKLCTSKVISDAEPFEEVPTIMPSSYEAYKEEPAIAQPLISLDVDDKVAEIGRARTRDVRAMNAAQVKDADFYRYHYGEELSAVEARVWWGSNDK